MKYATIIIRSLLGLIFVVFGANYFFPFLEMPPMEGHAGAFMGAMFASGYLGAVKVVEIIGGLLTLSGRYTTLGLLFLGPVIVNINLFDIYMVKAFNPLGVAVAAFSLFLVYVHRKNFLALICPGGSCKA